MVLSIHKWYSHWRIEDPQLSRSQVRIHTVERSLTRTSLPAVSKHHLVFVEDLSRNGVYLNNRLLGKKSAMALISDGDVLRLTSQTSIAFEGITNESFTHFSLQQERELKVSRLGARVGALLKRSGHVGRLYHI